MEGETREESLPQRADCEASWYLFVTGFALSHLFPPSVPIFPCWIFVLFYLDPYINIFLLVLSHVTLLSRFVSLFVTVLDLLNCTISRLTHLHCQVHLFLERTKHKFSCSIRNIPPHVFVVQNETCWYSSQFGGQVLLQTFDPRHYLVSSMTIHVG